MEVTSLIEAIKEKNKELFNEMVEKEGVKESLSSLSEIIGNRAYFTIDQEGNIKRKTMNYALPLGAFIKDTEKLGEYLFHLAKPVERVKHKKIERLSREDRDKLFNNFFKIMANNNYDFAKRYSKEMYLRDKEAFFKKLFHYTLMEEIDSQKTLMALALKKLLWEGLDDNILNAGISYIANVKSDLRSYEKAGASENSKKELLTNIEILKNGSSKEELNLLAYLLVLKEYDYSNESKFAAIAQKRLEEISKTTTKKELNDYETEIIRGL